MGLRGDRGKGFLMLLTVQFIVACGEKQRK